MFVEIGMMKGKLILLLGLLVRFSMGGGRGWGWGIGSGLVLRLKMEGLRRGVLPK